MQFFEGRKKYFLPVIVVAVALLTLLGVYLFRSPVLIVSDSSFGMLYGVKRLKRQESGVSRALFRRLVWVNVDEGAGPDLIALAVEGAHKAPWAVLFPYRYIEGARNFLTDRPDVPVLVMTGGNLGIQPEPGFALVNTDMALDLYRAGLCAALLAGENRVYFISDGTFTDELKDAFQEGLRAQGHLEDAIWTFAGFDFSTKTDLGCILVTGTAGIFIDENFPVPVILFSWLDPVYTPKTVKLMFDDSPLAFAAEALKLLPKPGEEVFIDSSVLIFRDRIAEKKDFRKIEGFVKENFQNE